MLKIIFMIATIAVLFSGCSNKEQKVMFLNKIECDNVSKTEHYEKRGVIPRGNIDMEQDSNNDYIINP